ncbi:MAG: hypothetical protein KDD66_02365 [Bdellovibrionales bacterium]|nr:hypothetical protein [Bdellovibrionales bacterium]
MDTCLPPYDGASRIFPHSGPKPILLCSSVTDWDFWAREKQAIRASKQNLVRDAPGSLQTDDGKPTKLLFSADAIKLTVLLSKVPGDRFANFQVFILLFVLSIFFGVVWQWLYYLSSSPKNFARKKGAPPPKSMASQTILPDYLTPNTLDNARSKRRPSDRASSTPDAEAESDSELTEEE